ncbi:MAG: DUF2125 domain-containing protein [Parvibaculaceae bacterium]
MAERRSRPWPIILTLIGIVLLVVLWCAYWVIASGLLRDRFESERAELARRGIAFDCKAAQWSGFPFRFERDCIAPTLAAAGETIAAKNLLLVLQAYMPNRAVALIDGPVTTASGLTVTHERAMASARFSGMRDWQASLELPKLQAPAYGAAERLLLSARDTGGDRLDVALDATAAEMLLGPGHLLKLDEAALAANLPRKIIGRDLLAALAGSGEKIGIDSIRLKKGDLVVTAKGEIGLSAAGLVDGRLVTTSNRLDLLVAELEQNFGLSAKDAQALTTMIGLLQPGKTTDVTLDLIAKDGKLYWGPVKLTELPPVL